MTKLHEWVRKVRSTTGLSQQDFADKYGFHARTFQGWETEGRKPDRSSLVLLAMIEHAPGFVERMIARLRQQGNPYVSQPSRKRAPTKKTDL